MGIFDFFKSPEQKKLQEIRDRLYRDIFPGGKNQQENEVQEVRQLLNFKYTKEATEQAFIYAVVSYYTSKNPRIDDIVDAVLRNPKTSVTKEDAQKICLYIENKRAINSSISVGKTLSQNSDGDKLFMIAFGAVVEIKKAYKDLTNAGKFEVLIFNSLIALQEYQSIRPDKYQETSEIFFKNLFEQVKTYNITMPPAQLAEFVNSRFESHIQELMIFFEEENENGYLLLKAYTYFYENPLEPNPKTSVNLLEYITFFPALMQMRSYVIEKTHSIFE